MVSQMISLEEGGAAAPKVSPVMSKLKVLVKLVLAVACLYFFICSLDFLSTSFRLLGGKEASTIFTKSDLLKNPIVGLMLGVLGTVLVQSSSTTTSIIVGMVAADIVSIHQAIPMIMGANIGTSVTNTIVSVTQIGNRLDFERAFGFAVVHDFFNWLAVLLFLPIEVLTGFLESLTGFMVNGINPEGSAQKPPDILKALTKPLTKLVVQIDKKVLKGWSLNDPRYANTTSLLKHSCQRNVTPPVEEPVTPLVSKLQVAELQEESYKCGYLFALVDWDDVWIGLLMLIFSLALLSFCLIMLVKILNSLMQDKMAVLIKDTLNAELPYVPWLTGYLAIAIGAVLTFLVQSSSVFTSALTPLVGTGLFSLERAYPLTLGSNLGTTTTGLLAALAADGEHLRNSLQIALCHLLFNVVGILVYYVVPFMRWPIPLARVMGRTVAKYRWVAFVYLVGAFFLFPLSVFGLSLIGSVALYIVLMPSLVIFIGVVLINVMQNHRPDWLPRQLKNWDFLPLFLRSLKPYDRALSNLKCIGEGEDTEGVFGSRDEIEIGPSGEGKEGQVNQAFQGRTQ